MVIYLSKNKSCKSVALAGYFILWNLSEATFHFKLYQGFNGYKSIAETPQSECAGKSFPGSADKAGDAR